MEMRRLHAPSSWSSDTQPSVPNVYMTLDGHLSRYEHFSFWKILWYHRESNPQSTHDVTAIPRLCSPLRKLAIVYFRDYRQFDVPKGSVPPSGPGSAVRILTWYGLDGPGIGSRWGRDFSHQSRSALRPTQPPIKWVWGLSRGWGGRGMTLTTYPLLTARLKKE